MPTWGEILKELVALQAHAEQQQATLGQRPGIPSPHDILRRKYLKQLSELTGRATIVYATSWQESKPGVSGADVSVQPGDMAGFMEACSNVSERELDLILHSPGGSAEAAEAIMHYLRTRFDHIRAIVPLAAMSAATMMALACDEVVMGAHSQLGPIDPQLTINTPEGPRSAPGQAIIDQFAKAKEECQDPKNLAAWMPILRGYGPGLLAICDSQRKLAVEFAKASLSAHMFRDETDSEQKADDAARWFADFKEFNSHGRRVGRDDARAQQLKVVDLEEDDAMQDAVLSVFHTVSHTFSGTPSVKLVENHHGRAWIQMKQVPQLVMPGLAPAGLQIPHIPPVQKARHLPNRPELEPRQPQVPGQEPTTPD